MKQSLHVTHVLQLSQEALSVIMNQAKGIESKKTNKNEEKKNAGEKSQSQ